MYHKNNNKNDPDIFRNGSLEWIEDHPSLLAPDLMFCKKAITITMTTTIHQIWNKIYIIEKNNHLEENEVGEKVKWEYSALITLNFLLLYGDWLKMMMIPLKTD